MMVVVPPTAVPPTAVPPTPLSDQEVSELAGRLRLAVARLGRQLRQMSDTDLSPTQLATLVTISTAGPVTLGELATLERVAPPSITKAVGRMVDAGLVARTVDISDRRITWVELTDEGRALLDHSRSRRNAWLATRLRDLPPDEVIRLAAATDVLEHLAGLDLSPARGTAPTVESR